MSWYVRHFQTSPWELLMVEVTTSLHQTQCRVRVIGLLCHSYKLQQQRRTSPEEIMTSNLSTSRPVALVAMYVDSDRQIISGSHVERPQTSFNCAFFTLLYFLSLCYTFTLQCRSQSQLHSLFNAMRQLHGHSSVFCQCSYHVLFRIQVCLSTFFSRHLALRGKS
jgi:hypothetical protein